MQHTHLKKSFFPTTTRLWKNVSIDVRSTLSLSVFKKSLLSYFSFPAKNVLYEVALDRFSSIIHTRLRLDACALNYYLFKRGRKESPACLCGFYSESVKHFFLKCPLFAASRHKLLSSAAQIFADRGVPSCLIPQLYIGFSVWMPVSFL